MTGEASVFCGETLAGTLTQGERSTVFEYASDFAGTPLRGKGISVHLPLAQRRFETPGTYQHPFFANLLPEGYRLDALRSRLKIASDDAFSLLMAVGADCIGNVSIRPTEEALPTIEPEITVDQAKNISFRDLLEKDLLSHTSVPGVQEKVSRRVITFPVRAKAASLLKLNPTIYPHMVENEHFFMRVAGDCGLQAAETRLIEDRNGEKGLLVRRFDRHEGQKLHQEDGCQLLDRYPGSKYDVSMRDLAQAIGIYASAPVIQNRSLFRLVAFSYVIGNGDLHAKNISLYRSSKGLFEMTPGYDLLSTLPYPVEQRMALKVNGKDDNFKRPFLMEFFAKYGISARIGDDLLDEICDGIGLWIPRLEEIGFDKKTTDKLRREIERRRDHLAK